MWRPYAELARIFFPNAQVIIDKYHFVRQVTWAIENVRKRLQKSMTATMRKYYKRSHSLILTRYTQLKDKDKKACDIMLLYNDDLRKAHMLKNGFMIFVRIKNTQSKELSFMNGSAMLKVQELQSLKNVLLHIGIGPKKY